MSPLDSCSKSKLPLYLKEVLAAAPADVDRRRGAAAVVKHLFPASHRGLENPSLPVRHVNGKALVPTDKLLELAFEKVTRAPMLTGGCEYGSGWMETHLAGRGKSPIQFNAEHNNVLHNKGTK